MVCHVIAKTPSIWCLDWPSTHVLFLSFVTLQISQGNTLLVQLCNKQLCAFVKILCLGQTVVVHAFNPSIWEPGRLRQFKARASSRTAKVIQRNLVLETKPNKQTPQNRIFLLTQAGLWSLEWPWMDIPPTYNSFLKILCAAPIEAISAFGSSWTGVLVVSCYVGDTSQILVPLKEWLVLLTTETSLSSLTTS